MPVTALLIGILLCVSISRQACIEPNSMRAAEDLPWIISKNADGQFQTTKPELLTGKSMTDYLAINDFLQQSSGGGEARLAKLKYCTEGVGGRLTYLQAYL